MEERFAKVYRFKNVGLKFFDETWIWKLKTLYNVIHLVEQEEEILVKWPKVNFHFKWKESDRAWNETETIAVGLSSRLWCEPKPEKHERTKGTARSWALELYFELRPRIEFRESVEMEKISWNSVAWFLFSHNSESRWKNLNGWPNKLHV